MKVDFIYDDQGNVTDPDVRRLILNTIQAQEKYDLPDMPHPTD